MSTLQDVHLVIVYQSGHSLEVSVRCGQFEREMSLFRFLRPHFKAITLVTHGSQDRVRFSDALGGIDICCNEKKWPGWLYQWWLSSVFAPKLSGKVIVRSDQFLAAGLAFKMARRVNGWFVVRGGYMGSDFAVRRWGEQARETTRMRALEKKVLPVADLSIVTTAEMKQRIRELYSVPEERIQVVPNYVDTQLMSPSIEKKSFGKNICFVARLEEQKNPLNLMRALVGTGATLTVVGRGPLLGQMQEIAARNNIRVDFYDVLPHRKLVDVYRNSDIFVLPSNYEGHPKTLLEAMACGLPVIGADSPGVRENIEFEVTGYLCGTGVEEIRSAILEVLGNSDLASRMGNAARQYALATFSLDRIVELELSVMGQLVSESQKSLNTLDMNL